MKIYTRTGDQGTTGLYGGGRVAKHDIRMAAHGSVDEMNAHLGLCRSLGLPPDLDQLLGRMQHEFFALGAELSATGGIDRQSLWLEDSDVTALEQAIDHYD